MYNTLNIERLFHLIKRQGILNFYLLLIGIVGIFGILLLISLLVAHFNPEDFRDLFGLYMTMFFIGGYMFTSRVFSELNSSRKAYAFIMLPASTLEKFIGSWLLSSPVYVIVFTAFISVIYLISGLSAGISVSLASLFGSDFLRIVWIFMVTQTAFFLGACTFRNYNLLKTLFSMFLIIAIIGAFGVFMVWILFGGQIQGNELGADFKLYGEKFFTETIPFIFFYILGPFLLLVSYFKLKEREV